MGPLTRRCFQLTALLFSIHRWESVDVEGWLCALIYAILYRGLEHPRILVSVGGGSGTNTPWIPWDNLHLGESKVICGFSTARGSASQPLHCSRGNYKRKGTWAFILPIPLQKSK